MNNELGQIGKDFAIKAHREVNQLYDGYLPYEFHLRLAVKTAEEFMRLVTTEAVEVNNILNAVWCHDIIEDARKTYNDVKEVIGIKSAEIVFAVTNEKGRSRKERASPKYYQGIKDTENAVVVKLSDRIANATYGKHISSDKKMYKAYQREQAEFEKQLAGEQLDRLTPMLAHLRNLLR
jgi:(p)ppGpp synthase/HD superfamily hydrolase